MIRYAIRGRAADSEQSGQQEGAMKRAQVRQRIEQYYYQLTEGCGDANCANANCCSNVRVEPLPPNQAAARAVHLLTASAPLCEPLRHKVRRTAAGRGPSPPSTSRAAPTPAGDSPVAQQAAASAGAVCSAATTITAAPAAGATGTCNSSAASTATDQTWSADRLMTLVEESARARDYTAVIRAIGQIFSEPEALTSCFRRAPAEPPEKGQLDAGEKEVEGAAAAAEPPADQAEPPVDLAAARRLFALLFATGDSPFTTALVTALTTLADGLRASLQFAPAGARSSPADPVAVLLLVLEIPALSSSEFLELALPRLCQAAGWLPTVEQARLVRFWSRYPADRLRDMVQTLQQLISVKVIEQEATRGYQATDDESVTAPVRLLKLLYYASLVGGRRDPPSARDDTPEPAEAASPGGPLLLAAKESGRERAERDPLEVELDTRPIDCRVPLVGFDEFYNEPLSEVVEMDHDYRYYKEYPERFSFMRHPFVLTPATKSLGLYYDSRIRMYHERHLALVHNLVHGEGQPYLRLRVRRDFIIEDALIALEIMALENPDDLKKQLVVQFEGEQGVDEGGVSKEFFQLIVEAIFNPDYGMFTYSEETRAYWFNPTSFENDAQFTLIGIVVGLALYNNVILDMRFPMVVYRKLMGQKGTFEDLAELSPTLYRSLQSMLEYEGDDMEDVFMQTFQVGYTDVFGANLTHDLRANGAQIPVNRSNVQDFADRYADFLLNTSVVRQFGAFRRGFCMVTDESPLWGLFRPDEVELLDYDFHELEAGTEYDGGFSRDSPTVRNFWRVVHDDMSDDDRRRLLEFTTGSDRVPVGGLRKLKLIIARNGPDSERLPTAHTCFNVLLLPDYRTREKLRELLLKAVSFSKGFGML
ncbi:Ubiquitin-protein ligase E3A [Amphibalanus amphitrite]|uniref:Ubiquitin-protein ligase E3A n=1 Tax=Amphibalanus amphitrite TaxID=1232801 RepID=A0A6A4WLX9_AMPAM|nr:Ubiquitin-protein ligase E3A [Amphibalanus amphitrite]